ncbi:MAG: dTMP kinase [Phycisphaeraceae bacterium]|nr:dTMP kinase [Phycisphaeraceae bacterium]
MNATTLTWMRNLGGKFIVFDGPDGSGKSTQFRRFAALVQQQGVGLCEVREPGGTAIGEQIRTILLDPANDDMDLRCEMLLYMASRAQLTAQRIEPAMREGKLVLADRFISSTMAYQGSAGGIPVADILRTGQIALRQCWPDLVVVFDVDEATAATRLSPLLDRMEQKGSDYHRIVRQGYLEQARNDPRRYLVLDARADVETVFSQLLSGLENMLGNLPLRD